MTEKTLIWFAKWTIYGGLFLIGTTILVYFFNGYINFNDIDATTIGTFGDFIGGFIGTLFSVATVLLVWLTYKSQNQQIIIQENQIKNQESFLYNQKFEDTFFKLLEAQAAVKARITFDTKNRLSWWESQKDESNEIISGDIFFNFAKEDFYRIYWHPNQIAPAILMRHDDVLEHLLPGNNEIAELDNPDRRIRLRYKKFFDTYHSALGHYFRHLYYILKYIDANLETELDQAPLKAKELKDKYQFYVGILQAQMNSSELFLLFYNGWCFSKMKSYILKYELLENLAEEDLVDTERHKDLYGDSILKSRINILDANP